MILRNTPATLSITIYQDGTATDPDDGGTVSVADAAGTVIASGAGTRVGSNTGRVTYQLTAANTADVNRLTITWDSLEIAGNAVGPLYTYAEVAGELLFEEAEARAFDNGAMSNTTNYTDAMIAEARTRIHDAFETILGYPLGRRYYRETLNGSGLATLLVERGSVVTVRTAETRLAGAAAWAELDADELADLYVLEGAEEVYRETLGAWPYGRQNVRLSYEAGRPIHPEIKRAALIVARNQIVVSNIPARALSESTQTGQISLATANSTRGYW